MSLARAYLGLGANLGDRAGALAAALERLSATPGIEVVRCSPVYETEPVGVTDQPPFLNACAEVLTSLDPEKLLDACLAIEAAMGRERVERWGPRPIDLDVLLIEEREIETERLTIPHPRLLERAFALAPLCDLDRDLRVPPSFVSVGEAVARLDRSAVQPYAEPFVVTRKPGDGDI